MTIPAKSTSITYLEREGSQIDSTVPSYEQCRQCEKSVTQNENPYLEIELETETHDDTLG